MLVNSARARSWLKENFFRPRNCFEVFGVFFIFARYNPGLELHAQALICPLLVTCFPGLFPFACLYAAWRYFPALPITTMHLFVLTLLSVGVIPLYAAVAARGRERVGERCWNLLAPALRQGLILVYFFSGLTKLNSGFFDPVLSCVSACYLSFGELLTGHAFAQLPPWSIPALAAATILFELCLATCLARPSWRNRGVLLGVLFHFALCFMGHFRLSAVMLLFYLAFLPPGLMLQTARSGVVRASMAAGLLVFALIFVFGSDIQQNHLRDQSATNWAAFLCELIFFGPFWVLIFRSLFSRPQPAAGKEHGFSLWHPAAALPLLILLVGLAPFLGLGTQNTFSILYSNLLVEGGETNHLFIPAGAIELFPYERDVVAVDRVEVKEEVMSSLVGKQKMVLRGFARGHSFHIPRFELQRWALDLHDLGLKNGVRISYEYGGNHLQSDLLADPNFNDRPRSWKDKFLAFRNYHEKGGCTF